MMVQRSPDEASAPASAYADLHDETAEAEKTAGQVFDHIERRLRASLLVARERVGRTTDMN